MDRKKISDSESQTCFIEFKNTTCIDLEISRAFNKLHRTRIDYDVGKIKKLLSVIFEKGKKKEIENNIIMFIHTKEIQKI